MGEIAEGESQAQVEKGRVIELEELTRWKANLCVAQAYQKKRGNAITGTNVTEGRWDTNIRALDGDFNSRTELAGTLGCAVSIIGEVARKLMPVKSLTGSKGSLYRLGLMP